jgi:hypothetical protein
VYRLAQFEKTMQALVEHPGLGMDPRETVRNATRQGLLAPRERRDPWHRAKEEKGTCRAAPRPQKRHYRRALFVDGVGASSAAATRPVAALPGAESCTYDPPKARCGRRLCRIPAVVRPKSDFRYLKSPNSGIIQRWAMAVIAAAGDD